MSGRECRIVVLVSGGGTNLQAILDATDRDEIRGKVVAVVSNRESAYGLTRAAQASIATEVVDHRPYPDRESFDRELIRRIDAYAPDLLVLAGFMRILSAPFVEHYEGRMLNIHPSLLPAYRGLHTHARALADGVSEHGASVHFVTSELDGGPTILQARVPVLRGDTAETLAKRVLEQEHIVYPLVVKWFCQGRLALRGGAVELDGTTLARPLLLNDLGENDKPM